jgi:hypothetical protein
MSRRIWIGVLVAGVLGVSLGSSARADVPAYLTQQGRLFDSMKNPVSGMTTFVFSLYTTASAGTAVWTETQLITLDSGYFSAQLGEVTAIPPTTFVNAASMGQTLYLGIKVNSDPELSPRQPLLSVPYALVAQNAIGDITPHTVSVNGKQVIDSNGNWVGPTMGGSHPVMASGYYPNNGQGATLGVSPGVANAGNHLWAVTLTAAQLGNATNCMVTVTGNVCGDPSTTTLANSFVLIFAGAQAHPSNTITDSMQSPWTSPPFANTNPPYACIAGTASYTFTITPGMTSYDFGCGFATAVAVPAHTATNAQGAYCQASVVCF